MTNFAANSNKMKAKSNLSLLIIAICLLAISSCIVSCKHESKNNNRRTDILELMKIAQNKETVNGLIMYAQVADSFYAAGNISETMRDYLNGYYQFYEVYDFNKADSIFTEVVDRRNVDKYDRMVQVSAAYERTYIQQLQGHIETSTVLALDALKRFKLEEMSEDIAAYLNYVNLYVAVGVGMVNRSNEDEAEKYFEKAYNLSLQYEHASVDKQYYLKRKLKLLNDIISSYGDNAPYQKVLLWVERQESTIAQYEKLPAGEQSASLLDQIKGMTLICKAQALQHLGREKEALQAYKEYDKTDSSKRPSGYANHFLFLYEAKRWEEAAKYMETLDRAIGRYGMDMNIEVIGGLYLKKYMANLNAGRKDTAAAVADKICQNLSSAIDNFTHDKVLEMASIYDMNEKDSEIADQKAKLLQTRVLALMVALLLAVIFFAIYAVIRRRQRIRLEEKNQQLMIANERAEESSRMKTKFIQQISHEIRTPLNILSGFTQVVTAEGMELDEAARHDANQQILENTDRITGLINKMLELSDASSRTVIPLTDQVSALQIANQAVLSSGIEEAAHLDFQLQDTDGAGQMVLTTNQQAAARVLSLLLDNAIKFTAPAEAYGHQAIADKKRATLTIAKHDGFVQFAVEDTGIGVPAAEAEHIFDEFVQLNEYYDGAGIGLTVARSLARRLGGDVVLDTTHTPGARFVFTLPMSR